MSWERILDVNLNRLTETIKFLEDITRFNHYPTSLLKRLRRLRSDFLTIKKALPLREIIRYRDSHHDQGRSSRFDTLIRRSAAETVAASFSRAKESSRIIEEILKIYQPGLSGYLKKIRFTIYDLEKEILAGRQVNFDPSFQAILDETYIPRLDLVKTLKILKKGGVTMIQLRSKNWTDREFLRHARHLRKANALVGLTYLVNDRVDIALAAGADGVHLGRSDLPVMDARRLMGETALIGASAANLSQALQAEHAGADYIGAGAVFSTATKIDAAVCGISELRRICQRVRIPVIAIGGITAANVQKIRQTGCAGIAVCSALFNGSLPDNLRSLTGK